MSDGSRILYGRDEIGRRVQELGTEITRDYAGRCPILVSVLKGAVVFVADLMRCIDLPLSLDFMSISTYGPSPQPFGVVRILKDLEIDIGGQHVILVEDIIDTGLTLSYLLTALRTRRPASLEVCTLLDRSVRRIPPVEIRYRGFDIPDVFVVGYGLDHEGRHRNLPFLLSVDKQATLEANPAILDPFLP